MLPFTPERFLAVFVNYNNAIWPIQIAAYLLGGIAVALLSRKTRESDRALAGILAVMWLWTGVGYHGLSFSVINKAAYLFAVLFVVQGCHLTYAGVYRHQIRFGLRPGLATGVGAAFVAYAAIVYPLIGVATGHRYPEMAMFGVTPCPYRPSGWQYIGHANYHLVQAAGNHCRPTKGRLKNQATNALRTSALFFDSVD